MGSDNKGKKQFLFGKFGKVVIREAELPKTEEPLHESSLSAVSNTGKVIGTVTIATSIFTGDVIAGATGIPY